MAQIAFKDEQLNVDLVMNFLNSDLEEVLKEEPAWKKMMEIADNLKEATYNHTTIKIRYNIPSFYVAGAIAVVFVTIGMAGLIHKVKAKDCKAAVKITRCSVSAWVLLVGLLMAGAETAMFLISSHQGITLHLLNHTLFTTLSSLIRIAVVAFKIFSIILYSFQNIMIFFPFFFRRNRKRISKWLIRLTLGQWVFTTTVFLVTSVLLVYVQWENDVCMDVFNRADIWKLIIVYSTYFGFLASLLLSAAYLIGYYKHNKFGKADKRLQTNMKRTFLSCFVEIAFDFGLMLYINIRSNNCLVTGIGWKMVINTIDKTDDLFGYKNCTSLESRMNHLEFGFSNCGVQVLASQPLCQEVASLLFDLFFWLYPH